MIEIRNAIKTVREASKMLLAKFGPQLKILKQGERSQIDTDYDSLSLKIICQGLRQHYPQDGLMGEGLQELSSELGLKLDDRGIFPGESGKIWAIDSICGSIPFSRGIPDFIISVACVSIEPLKPLVGIVLDPVRDELFCAKAKRGSFLNNSPIRVSTLGSLEQFRNQGMISIEHKMIREQKYNKAVVSLAQKVARLRVAGTCGLELAYVAAGRLDAVLKAKQPLYDYAAGLLILQEAGGMATDFDGSELATELTYRKVTDVFASNGKLHKLILDELSVLRT
jgi:myo-inositol-1(or 4)-monophosphatase